MTGHEFWLGDSPIRKAKCNTNCSVFAAQKGHGNLNFCFLFWLYENCLAIDILKGFLLNTLFFYTTFCVQIQLYANLKKKKKNICHILTNWVQFPTSEFRDTYYC